MEYLSTAQREQWQKHVLESWPNESAGVICENSAEYIRLENAANDPRIAVKIRGSELFEVTEKYGKVQIFLHSHAYECDQYGGFKYPPQWPSSQDTKSFIEGDVDVFGIVACDGEGFSQEVWLDKNHHDPLIGRPFIHFKNDCYSSIRDWYKTQNIELKDYPRSMFWWENGENMYDENFADAGFVEVDGDPLKGDVYLFKINSPVTNHGAVITDDKGTVLHHLVNRLSGVDKIHRWRRYIVKHLRYAGSNQ